MQEPLHLNEKEIEKGLNTKIKSGTTAVINENGELDKMRMDAGDGATPQVGIREGEFYIVETKNVDKAHELIMNYIAENDKENSKYMVNIFTRHMPVVCGQYREAKGIGGNVFEISTMGGKNRISPASLGYIKHIILSTASGNKKPIFVIDCIDIMAMFADKEKVRVFLEELRDIITAGNGIGFVIIDPTTYDDKELAQLRRFKNTIKV